MNKSNYLKVFNAKGEEIYDFLFEELGIEIKMPKLIVTVEKSEDGIIVENVYDNRTCEKWTMEQMYERNLCQTFSDKDDLKESLNWYLNGDSRRYKIRIQEKTKEKTTYTCFIYD